MHWSAAYVGLPWREKGRDRTGLDCYGLVRLVYADELGIDLPSYAEAYAGIAERAEIAALIAADAARWPWVPVAQGEERAFDVAVFRRGRLEAHVGIVVGGRRMLHILEGCQACIAACDGRAWSPRHAGFYRYRRI
jgi:cell wall-associated NlpC family hydrolase